MQFAQPFLPLRPKHHAQALEHYKHFHIFITMCSGLGQCSQYGCALPSKERKKTFQFVLLCKVFKVFKLTNGFSQRSYLLISPKR